MKSVINDFCKRSEKTIKLILRKLHYRQTHPWAHNSEFIGHKRVRGLKQENGVLPLVLWIG